jgi:hypothetical protein
MSRHTVCTGRGPPTAAVSAGDGNSGNTTTVQGSGGGVVEVVVEDVVEVVVDVVDGTVVG